MDKKRLLFLLIFIIVSILFGYLLYRVFFAPTAKPKPTPTVTPTTTVGGLPVSGVGGQQPAGTGVTLGRLPTTATGRPTTARVTTEPIVTRIVSNQIKQPNLNTAGQLNFYNQTDGKFYHLKDSGELETLTDKVFFQVDNVTWSPKDNEAILEYPDGSNIYYNFTTQQQVTLPKHWQDFSFSTLGDKIASKSMALSPENRWLITANTDGSNISYIEPMGNNADKVIMDWSPNQQVVALSRTGEPLGGNRQEILLIGLNGENFKSLTVEGFGFASQWSPTGKKLLYNVYNTASDYKPELWITNASGDQIDTGRQPLKVNTWADKCTFTDERFVYCAVPSSLPTGAGFAPKVADTINDVIYRIDTQTGLHTPIQTDGNHTVQKIIVNSETNTLYFTDKNQSGLFEMKL